MLNELERNLTSPIAAGDVLESGPHPNHSHKKAAPGCGFWLPAENYAAIEPLSLFMAFFSSWRMRSAETLYLAARSCRVAFSSASQRW